MCSLDKMLVSQKSLGRIIPSGKQWHLLWFWLFYKAIAFPEHSAQSLHGAFHRASFFPLYTRIWLSLQSKSDRVRISVCLFMASGIWDLPQRTCVLQHRPRQHFPQLRCQEQHQSNFSCYFASLPYAVGGPYAIPLTHFPHYRNHLEIRCTVLKETW